MIKKILISCLVLLTTTVSFAQILNITGKIIDNVSNNPIKNATIKVINSNIFEVSNSDGEFSLQSEEGAILEISHVSYKTIRIKLKNNLIIKLQLAQIELNEIIVASNPLEDISQSKVINDTEKRISQPRSVGSLFKDINGFGIVKRGAYASEPVFRAFKYEQLNVQYDGGMKILNACPNRMDPITTHVIPEEIEKIEIVKGPFTVRFGSNFGGIINLVTKNPSKNQYGFHGSVEGGYETNGSNFVNGVNLLYVNEKFDVQLNGSHRDFSNYTDGNGTEVPSSFRTNDYSVKVGINPSNKQRLQLTWRQSFGSDIDHAGLPMDSPFDNSLLAGLDYKITDLTSKINSFTFKAFYSYVDHLMTNENRSAFLATDARSPVNSWVYGGKTEFTFKIANQSKLFVGADANLINRKGNRTRVVKIMNGITLPTPKTFIDKIWQDATLNDIGIFTQGKFKITNYFSISSGIRADFISTFIDDAATDFEALYGGTIPSENEINVSGNISFKYQHNGFQTQLAFGRGVKTASMIERYINHFNVGADPYEYVGNPNLNPEVNNQIEWSFSKTLSHFKLSGTVFHSFLEDYISAKVNTNIPRKFMPTTPPIYTKQFVNLNKASQTGFEFNMDYRATQNLKFTSSISYTRGENMDLNEPLPQIPPFMAILGTKYENANYWFAFNTRFVAKQNRVSSSYMETETPSFGTIDFRVGFEPIHNLTIGFAALNILDKAYYEHLNYSFKGSNTLSGKILEPGRNFTTYIKYKF
ncbi:MAG: TonB-dependent receptor [Lutibacter sp.]|uniref:TonB-dependent receptor domain-containing protein n=1 Tax=Lutibacter sp. TaxID=1925666 RepID=UPI00385D5074